MKFSDYCLKRESLDEPQIVPDSGNHPQFKYDISTEEGWINHVVDEMIENPHKKNSGSQEQQLANVIYGARHGFPPGSKKVCTTGGEDREWNQRLRTEPITQRLWQLAQEEVKQGKIKIIPYGDGQIIGEPNAVKQMYQFLSTREQKYGNWPRNPDYHTQFGRMVGYPEKDIQNFLSRLDNHYKQKI